MHKILAYFHSYPLLISLITAFILRTITSFINYGPAELDDYNNIIAPALNYILQGNEISVPALRFPILPYLFSWLIYPFYTLGITTPHILISFGYWMIGLISLLQVWGTYKLGNLYLDNKWRNYFTFFTANYFFMPFISTRVYLESFAIISFTWSFYFIGKSLQDHHKMNLWKDYFFAGLFISISTFFRFYLAPIFLIFLGFSINRRKSLKPIFALILGGLVTVLLMIVSEKITGKQAFSTVIEFWEHNYQNHIQTNGYGHMPWFTYFLILICIFIPPFSLGLIRCFIKGSRQIPITFLSLAFVFIILHLIDHKLDRFLIPLLPIFFLLTFKGIQDLFLNKIVRYSFIGFTIVNTIFTFFIIFSGTQMAAVNGIIALKNIDGNKIIYQLDPIPWVYYGINKDHPHVINQIHEIHYKVVENKWKNFYILSFLELSDDTQKYLLQNYITCKFINEFKPYLVEDLVIKINPEFNNRRRKTVLYQCNINN